MSCNLEKDARLALCVEVEVKGPDVRVVRMVATGDFGAALNPDALQNQMTGAIIQGMGGALWEQVALRHDRADDTPPVAVPRAPLQRRAGDGRAGDRPARRRAGRCRRVADHADRAGDRRGHLRRDRRAPALVAVAATP